MDHSLEGYLQRQSTMALQWGLFNLRETPQTEHTQYLIDLIERVLNKREDASS